MRMSVVGGGISRGGLLSSWPNAPWIFCC